MRITSFVTRVVDLPAGRGPLGEIPFRLGSVIAIQVRTDEGIEGISYCAYVDPRTVAALAATVDAVLEAACGLDIWATRAFEVLRRRLGNDAPAGMVTRAMSALDVALWDLRGKAANLPVWRLLGAAEPRVACYASGHLWRHYTLAELEESAGAMAAMGFRAMKLRCGAEVHPTDEIERLRVVRQAVGDRIDVMVDINQGWSVTDAVRIGRHFAEYDLYWLEDPINCEDVEGHATIAAALDTPVCAGEYLYGLAPLRELIVHRSVDILMVDCLHAGGVSGFMKAAHLAEAHNLPVVSHLTTEFLAHAVGACANGLTVEHMPWTFPLFEEVPALDPVDGCLVLSDRAGFGLDFDEDRISSMLHSG